MVYQTDNAAISEGAASASSNPLKCYIYPKTSILYQQQSGTAGVKFTRTPTDFKEGHIYGITSGGVSFSDVTVSFRYFGYKTKIIVKTGKEYEGESLTISGNVNVGDTFNSNDGSVWTCESIVWYKEKDVTGAEGRMNLPLGVFTSPGRSEKAYCLYLTKVNNDSIGGWFIALRSADFVFGWSGVFEFNEVHNTYRDNFR